jgi:hypothetical protein
MEGSKTGEDVRGVLDAVTAGSAGRDETGEGGDACWTGGRGSVDAVGTEGRDTRVDDMATNGRTRASEGAFDSSDGARETSEAAFCKLGRSVVGEGGVGGFVRSL